MIGQLCLLALALFTAVSSRVAAAPRDHIPASFKWNLLTLYPDWTAWEEGIRQLEVKVKAFAGLKGTLVGGARHLLRACELNDEIGALQQRLFRYVQLQSDANTADEDLQVRMRRMLEALHKSSAAMTWFGEEIRQILPSALKSLVDATPSLRPYRYFLLDASRPADAGFLADPNVGNTVRAAEEAVAAYVRLSTGWDAPSGGPQIDDRDTPHAEAYYSAVTSERDSAKRARAAQSFFKALQRNQDVYCDLYRKVIERDWTLANARRHASSFEDAVAPTGYSLAQVQAFLDEVHRDTAPLRDYQTLRKRILRLGSYHQCDSLLPLWPGDGEYSYPEAQSILASATNRLGPEYALKLKSLLVPGWIDLYPSHGKRSGSCIAGVYRIGAFELINYQNDLRSLFSVAHESGHAVHALLSYDSQPFCTAEPSVFIAETAAMLDEQLVYRYLANRRSGIAAERALLDHRARTIVSEFYRQAILADFESSAHRLVEQNHPVTAGTLNELYGAVLHEYYGDAFAPDEFVCCEWAGVPHLFTAPFYVYQYATSFAISSEMSRRIMADPGGWNPAGYLAMLKSGGAGRPRDLIEEGGIAWDGPASARAVAEELAGIVARLGTISQD